MSQASSYSGWSSSDYFSVNLYFKRHFIIGVANVS